MKSGGGKANTALVNGRCDVNGVRQAPVFDTRADTRGAVAGGGAGASQGRNVREGDGSRALLTEKSV